MALVRRCVERSSKVFSLTDSNVRKQIRFYFVKWRRSMRRFALGLAVTAALSGLPLMVVCAQTKDETQTIKVESARSEAGKIEQFKPEQQASKGSVTIAGSVINYDAYAGTLVVHTKDWDDVPQNRDKDDKNQAPEASMFYVADFKSDGKGASRPLTFLYNGGPGSSTVWLHMGAVWAERVSTIDDSHTPAA